MHAERHQEESNRTEADEQKLLAVAAELGKVRRRLAELEFRRDELLARVAVRPVQAPTGPFMAIPEVAELLRCKNNRVDKLLSNGTLTRVKDGRRTLIRRAEVLAYLAGEPTGPRTLRRRAA